MGQGRGGCGRLRAWSGEGSRGRWDKGGKRHRGRDRVRGGDSHIGHREAERLLGTGWEAE